MTELCMNKIHAFATFLIELQRVMGDVKPEEYSTLHLSSIKFGVITIDASEVLNENKYFNGTCANKAWKEFQKKDHQSYKKLKKYLDENHDGYYEDYRGNYCYATNYQDYVYHITLIKPKKRQKYANDFSPREEEE